MYKNILVATDLTEASAPVLRVGLALAHKLGATLTALHVTEPPFEPPRWHSFRERVGSYDAVEGHKHQQHMEQFLDTLTTEYQPDPSDPIPVEVRVVSGQPDSVIIAMATEIKVDLIVMGTHGRRGFRHLVVGSVAEKVVRTAGCAVLTVRPDPTQAE